LTRRKRRTTRPTRTNSSFGETRNSQGRSLSKNIWDPTTFSPGSFGQLRSNVWVTQPCNTQGEDWGRRRNPKPHYGGTARGKRPCSAPAIARAAICTQPGYVRSLIHAQRHRRAPLGLGGCGGRHRAFPCPFPPLHCYTRLALRGHGIRGRGALEHGAAACAGGAARGRFGRSD